MTSLFETLYFEIDAGVTCGAVGGLGASLRSLYVSNPPKLVITDGSAALAIAGHAVWPVQTRPSQSVPFLARRQHHLHVKGVEAIGDAGMSAAGRCCAAARGYRVCCGPRAGMTYTPAPPNSPARS